MTVNFARSKTQVPHSTIERLRVVMPGQPVDWYIRIGQLIHDGLMPMPMPVPPRPIVEKCSFQPQRPTTAHIARVEAVQPQKPKSEVSEATRAKLLELCRGNIESAERLVAAQRGKVWSEEEAWQRAYDRLMDERVNLYANISYNT
jgi:hypothetical protein